MKYVKRQDKCLPTAHLTAVKPLNTPVENVNNLGIILFQTAPGGPVAERSPGVREVVGSTLSWVMPKTLKIVLGALLLSARHLKFRPWKYGRFIHCRP